MVDPRKHEMAERADLFRQIRSSTDIVWASAMSRYLFDHGMADTAFLLNVIQNLSILAMALSRVPPDEFYRLVFALKDAGAAVSQWTAPDNDDVAPGVGGAYRLLHDE